MKHITRPQYYRIKRVVEMLREGPQTGQWPNSGDFMRELEVSRRTVARDVDFFTVIGICWHETFETTGW